MRKKISLAILFLILAFSIYDIVRNSSAKQTAGTHVDTTIHQNWGRGAGEAAINVSENLLAKNYYIILDTSGSMGQKNCVKNDIKMNAAKRSLTQWIDNVNATDNVAFMTFRGDYAQEQLPLRINAPEYKSQFLEYISNARPVGKTPLGDALNKAYSALELQAKSQLGYGEYHIVVVTDGDASDERIMENATKEIFKSPVILHTIGFCISTNHALNQPGKAYYMSAMDEDALRKGLDNVLAESEQFDITDFKELQ